MKKMTKQATEDEITRLKREIRLAPCKGQRKHLEIQLHRLERRLNHGGGYTK